MKKKNIVAIIIIIFFLSGFFVWHFSLAYEPYPTHKSLAEKSAQLYNSAYRAGLTENDIQQIFLGAIQEDTAPRWINHFYDPTTGQGWTGERMGDLSSDIVQKLANIGLSDEKAVSSIQWAHDQKLQDKYLRYGGNQTFERAVYLYVNGKQKEAYLALGHVLHLVEDLTVPAHTRQDSHWDMVPSDPGEPYERWLKANTFLSHLNDLNPAQENFSCQNLDDCFIRAAKYSNENFFSEDTIVGSGYNYPKVVKIEDFGGYAYGYDVNNNILYKVIFKAGTKEVERITVDDPEINSAYWNRLSKKSVLAGVEILRIFHETVERAKHDQSIVQPAPPSSALWYVRALGAGMLGSILTPQTPKPISSPGGICYEIYSWVKETVDEHWDTDTPETYARSTLFDPGATVDLDRAQFEFYSSEENSVFECQIDGHGFWSCISPKGYIELSSGEHIFEVRAVDVAGNRDASPATITWTIVSPEPLPQPFSLYEAEEITATSAELRWESSFSEDYLSEYKIIRSLDLEFSASTTIATTSEAVYVDQTLNSETQYYYKIIACNEIDICRYSNNSISVLTPAFFYSWAEPQIISATTTVRSTMPSIAIGPDDLPAASWYTMSAPSYRNTMTFSQKIDVQTWSAPQYVLDPLMVLAYNSGILSGPQGFEIFYTGQKINSSIYTDIFLRRQVEGIWQPPQNILPSYGSLVQELVGTVDKFGITHLIWWGISASSSLPVARHISFDPFGAPIGNAEIIPDSLHGGGLDFVIDDDNNLHTIWYNSVDGDIYYSKNAQDGLGWQAAKKIFPADFVRRRLTEKPEIISDESGHFFVMWIETQSKIQVAEFDGIATTTATIFPYSTSPYAVVPKLILSQTKKPYLFFVMNNSMYFTFLGENGQWQPAQMAFEFNYGLPLGVSMAVDSNNILHIFWETPPLTYTGSYWTNSYIYYIWARLE